MGLFRSFTFLFSFLFFYSLNLQSQLNTSVEANIVVKPVGSNVLLTFLAINKTGQSKSLSYSLSIVRNEELGETYEKEDFEERFVLSPNERQVLKKILFDSENEPRTNIFILIFEEGEVIGKDRIVVNGIEGEDTLQPTIIKENQMRSGSTDSREAGLMRGIVVEDTKTKPGRDFYRMFYSRYNQSGINGSRIVKVKEELAIGGNTEIYILVDQDVVVRFIVNPRTEYLESLADRSLIMVANHFETLERLKNQNQKF